MTSICNARRATVRTPTMIVRLAGAARRALAPRRAGTSRPRGEPAGGVERRVRATDAETAAALATLAVQHLGLAR